MKWSFLQAEETGEMRSQILLILAPFLTDPFLDPFLFLFREGQGDVAVRYGKEYGLGEQGSEEQDLFLMTGGAEPAPFAGEG